MPAKTLGNSIWTSIHVHLLNEKMFFYVAKMEKWLSTTHLEFTIDVCHLTVLND